MPDYGRASGEGPDVGAPRVLFSTSRAAHEYAVAERVPAFSGHEWDALVAAAERDRLTWVQFRLWVGKKLADPGWRLTGDEAVGGVIDALERRASCADVLDACSLRASWVGVGAELWIREEVA